MRSLQLDSDLFSRKQVCRLEPERSPASRIFGEFCLLAPRCNVLVISPHFACLRPLFQLNLLLFFLVLLLPLLISTFSWLTDYILMARPENHMGITASTLWPSFLVSHLSFHSYHSSG